MVQKKLIFLLDTLKPLAPIDNEDVQVSLPSYLPSKSIVEVSENMRAKIYGLFCKLGKNLNGFLNYLFWQKNDMIFFQVLMIFLELPIKTN